MNEILNLDLTVFDPLLQFINQTISKALEQQASDIHFEPFENAYRVRARIDGLLYEIEQAPKQISQRLASRLKVLAQLDIAEQRLPQDGQLKVQLNNKVIDLRISTCCTVHGEKIVLRILNKQQLTIPELGLTPFQQQLLLDSLAQPQGMILVCGPTGSGKTMTLYAALQALNKTTNNIISIEDPVEIYLPGINQVNANNKIGLSFHHALRSFLRQDPDIIMLGEIRDLETAETAIKAAQTGHLVLATLHSNSAMKAITRLRNMGINHYDLADSLNLIVSQRLIRKICSHCKQAKETVTNCRHCQDGYSGRLALFEFLSMTPSIEEAIANGESTQLIASQTDSQSMQTLAQAAKTALQTNLTTLEEIKRVIPYEANIHLD